jgi:hypothetical protein
VDAKYWNQRYALFSLFDHGCLLDTVGWYSGTISIMAHRNTVPRKVSVTIAVLRPNKILSVEFEFSHLCHFSRV